MATVSEISLAPGLLLSMPHLHDPNFHRAVVLMLEHSEEGSFGLVLNRATDMSATEILGMLDIEWAGNPDAVVWSGGPVTPSSGWVLHEPSPLLAATTRSLATDIEGADTIRVCEGLDLSTSPDSLRVLAADPPDRLRFLLGYAGWGPGQLADEMARGSWLHADIDLELIFATPAEEMWTRALRSIGVDAENIVQGRGIH